MELIGEANLSTLSTRETHRNWWRCLRLSRRRMLIILTMTLLLGLGVLLRIIPSAGYSHLGQDEGRYSVFVRQIHRAGLFNYDAVVRIYMERQYRTRDAAVPATRIGFLAPVALAADVFHLDPLRALRLVSCLACLVLLGVTSLIGFRQGGTLQMIVLTALMAVAPLQIAFAQRAMIDG
jgi:hypothetical protein